MASTSTTKQSSRFSTLKVFKFTSSKPPPPPPKDGNHLYSSSSKNTSIVSFTNQSISQDSPASNSQPLTSSPQHNSNGNGPLSTRSPSPAPSRVLQQPQQQLEQQRQRQQQQSPPPSVSASTLMPDAASTSSKRSFFRKIPSFRKRSVSKGSRTANTNVDDPLTDDESISSPWNFQDTHTLLYSIIFTSTTLSMGFHLRGHQPCTILVTRKPRLPSSRKAVVIAPPLLPPFKNNTSQRLPLVHNHRHQQLSLLPARDPALSEDSDQIHRFPVQRDLFGSDLRRRHHLCLCPHRLRLLRLLRLLRPITRALAPLLHHRPHLRLAATPLAR
ncbi:hypothetical protein B0F90DRAFT_1209878 [Multifurca ochricompacta]|uniref:Uncharacterized protein n=1 Tax=Multifurca ochricompacta TaxID=376703 RepID=A0AAD4LY32_9AGAM|nr:hypothetical protein B0F90DRAFT_1209878 [Multifurca ochricompacta]